MDKEKILKIIELLEISNDLDSYKVKEAIKEKGFKEKIECFSGASKMCLVFDNCNFVVKWTHKDSWDYINDEALKECEIYQKAKERKLAMLFPYTELLGKVNDTNFILQEKIDFSCEDCPYNMRLKYQKISKTATDKIFNKMQKGFRVKKGYDRKLDDLWAKMAISLYGKRICKELCSFIQENKINDLHSSNLGYKNNRPIILDFSGYHR